MPTSLRTPHAPPASHPNDWPHTARWWPAHWEQLASPADSAVANMATDLALLHHADSRGTATLRTYRWHRPTVSFGRNERVRDRWDLAALQRDGFAVVRRPTGGRALLHVDDVTWSVTLPVPRDLPWRAVYDAVNRRLCAALLTLGIPVVSAAGDGGPPLVPNGEPCFAAAAAGELVLGDAKIGGSSVWREGRGYLQHGSLLLHNRQAVLNAYRLTPAAEQRDVASGDSMAAESARAGVQRGQRGQRGQLGQRGQRGQPSQPGQPHAAPHLGIAEWMPNAPHASRRRRVVAALHRAWIPEGDGAHWPLVRRHTLPPAIADRARALAPTVDAPDWLWRR